MNPFCLCLKVSSVFLCTVATIFFSIKNIIAPMISRLPMQKVSHSTLIHTKAIINLVHLYLCSWVTCSLNTSHYGHIYHLGLITCHTIWKNFIGNFSSSDITSKRKARHVHTLIIILVCLLNHLSTSISMSGIKHSHNQNLPATAQNDFFTFLDGFAPSNKHSLIHFQRNTKYSVAL